MKHFIYLFIGTLLFLGCQENEEKRFEGVDALYFQVNANWSSTIDSISYTFAGKGLDSDTLLIRVNLQGNKAPYGREIKVAIDPARTTATETLHYQALADHYTLPADSFYYNLPLVVYKKDLQLNNRSFRIGLKLLPSNDFQLGIVNRTAMHVTISNILKKPTYWDTLISISFGVYSQVKHETTMQLVGMDFPEIQSSYSSRVWEIYGRHVSNYFRENYPIRDENNVVIEPW